MKSEEIIKEYNSGRKIFQGYDLKGQSFEKQNLSGADFSNCDIRGTNFKYSFLENTKFYKAQAGLEKKWIIIIILTCFLILGLIIFSISFSSQIMGALLALDIIADDLNRDSDLAIPLKAQAILDIISPIIIIVTFIIIILLGFVWKKNPRDSMICLVIAIILNGVAAIIFAAARSMDQSKITEAIDRGKNIEDLDKIIWPYGVFFLAFIFLIIIFLLVFDYLDNPKIFKITIPRIISCIFILLAIEIVVASIKFHAFIEELKCQHNLSESVDKTAEGMIAVTGSVAISLFLIAFLSMVIALTVSILFIISKTITNNILSKNSNVGIGIILSIITMMSLILIIKNLISTEDEYKILDKLDYFLIFLPTLIGSYIGLYSVEQKSTKDLIFQLAVYFSSICGTSFYKANINSGDFTEAILKSTDFREANLIKTSFKKVKEINIARLNGTILFAPSIRELIVTRNGSRQSYKNANLSGANLTDTDLSGADLTGANLSKADLARANLSDANLTGANLNNVNLEDADLSRSKLIQAQLDKTNFTGATLTGICIEDWGITSKTNFRGVRCQYVYMRNPTKENLDPLRKPDNNDEVFEDGEFGDFIKPIVDTLDLYHSQNVDPRAIAIAFNKLAGDNSNLQLEIVAIERRGDDKILLRAKTAEAANKSELSRKYFINYNQLKQLAEKDFKELIKNKENQILRLESTIKTALARPNFYLYHKTMNDQRKINVTKGNYYEIEGNYIHNNYPAEQKQTLVEAAIQIQKLLKQLEQNNPNATDDEKINYVNDETTPSFKRKIISALTTGGETAIEEFLDNPYLNISKAIIKDWMQTN